MSASALIELVTGVVEHGMESHGVPGVAVGVSHRGERSFVSKGVTNVEHPLPVTSTTRFQVGSVTKTFTAAALVLLADDGLCDLDAPLGRLLPDLRLEDPRHLQTLTTRQVLCHLSGLFGDWILHAAPDFCAGDDALEHMAGHLDQVSFLVPPGEAFSYSNTAYCLAGHLMATVAGRTYEDAIEQLVLGPVGLTDTGFSAEDAITHRVAIGHHRQPDHTVTVARGSASWSPRWALQRAANPAGGLITTPEDLLLWTEQFLDHASSLPASTRDDMLTVHCASGGQGTHAGLGWHCRGDAGVEVWSHNGVTDGYVAHALVIPDHELAAVILTNSSMGHLVIQETRSALLGATGLVPDQPSAQDEPARSEDTLDLLSGTYADPLRELTLEPSSHGIDIDFRIRDHLDDELGEHQAMTAAPNGNGRLAITSPGQRAGQGLEYPVEAIAEGLPAPWIRFRGRLHPRAETPAQIRRA